MQNVNPADMKILSEIIFWAIHYDAVTPQMLMLKMGCKAEFAEAAFHALYSLGVISKNNPNNDKEPWIVMYVSIEDIPNEMINVLCQYGKDIKQIMKALEGLPKEKKKVTSNILSDKAHTWIDIKDEMPNEDEIVVIRMVNENKVYMQSRTELVYMEDLKIAKYCPNNDDIFLIEPPFPLYDYSPCSTNQFINKGDGVKITHWAKLKQEEIDSWHHRFDPHFKYNELKLYCGDDHIEEVYRALVLAASCIGKEAIQYPKDNEVRTKLEKAYNYICDLQAAMDRGGDVNAVGNG